MDKLRRSGLTLLVSASLLLSWLGSPLLPSSRAVGASIGTGACTSTVSSATGTDSAFANGYCYLAFTSGTNSWTPPSGITSADLLVVGGGGAGGAGAWGGGGGAGGVVYWAGFAVNSSTAYSTSVGAGGLTGNDNLTPATNRSNNGSDSWFASASILDAAGGGAGASYAYGSTTPSEYSGSNGGSGGGATENSNGGSGGTSTQTLPSGATVKYGNSGGPTAAAANQSGAGGGGAGGAVTTAAGYRSSTAGGAGINVFSSWTGAFATPYDVGGYIAGGGGGGSAGTRGLGGSGGGGNGGDPTNGIKGVNGVANTGSGGGGTSYNGTTQAGGNGGSGLIIIRFQPILNTTVAISLQSGLYVTTYRALSPISITVTGTNGKIKLTEDGKVIVGCKALTTLALSATCNWKPDLHRRVKIVATFAPSSGYTGSTSAPLYIQVNSRSNNR